VAARGSAPQGPLAAARLLDAAITPPTPDDALTEALLHTTQRLRLGPVAVAVGGEVLAWQQRSLGGGPAPRGAGGLRVNALHLSTEQGGWAFSAGKKVVGWDVGFGFRPNDVVQQESRRTLLSTPLEGRPLLQAEYFGADNSATTLVWVNPQRLHSADADSRGAGESALALHHYQQAGAVDWHAFARLGAHTAASLGLAFDWVAGDAWSVHGSARALQRHDGWATGTTTAGSLQRSNPWAQTTQGRAGQWLLGAQWTGAAQQSLMAELWHDGSAPPNALWRAWGQHNRALLASLAPAAARAGNLAWQATPFTGANLRQDNAFVRAAWQPGPWTLALDALWHPADRGQALTASLQWQGDRWRFNAALRTYGGPADALLAQLPQRQQALLAATWAF